MDNEKKIVVCAGLCEDLHMATNIQLDEALISDAQKLGNHPSKRATVEEALREYVVKRKQANVIQLFGKIDYEDDYDYKKARSGK